MVTLSPKAGAIMPTKITRDVLEGYLNCKLKGHLKLAGQHGVRCDYEALCLGVRGLVKAKAADQLRARHPANEVLAGVPITSAVLTQGRQLLLDATLEDDTFSLLFDGVQRTEGQSALGDFHYVPVLYHEARQLPRCIKALLEV
jgi:hypothetical protein